MTRLKIKLARVLRHWAFCLERSVVNHSKNMVILSRINVWSKYNGVLPTSEEIDKFDKDMQ